MRISPALCTSSQAIPCYYALTQLEGEIKLTDNGRVFYKSGLTSNSPVSVYLSIECVWYNLANMFIYAHEQKTCLGCGESSWQTWL